MSDYKITRRGFLAGTTVTLIGCATGPNPVPPKSAYVSPNGKLGIAGIGAGGQAKSDITSCDSENIVALCDVDQNQAAEMMARYPNAVFYQDFREMIDKQRDIDACTVSTPDHTHAVAAAYAMRNGKHVRVQKPLTHNIWEARELQRIARETRTVTQMGNQGHARDGVRDLCELIWSGAIGPVRECHIWTNRPVWPQGLNRPPISDPPPANLDWDLWLGPAPERPFVSTHPDTEKACYHPFVWRGWWDFGCGALGDMACHIADPPNWALKLTAPTSVEVVTQEGTTAEMAPNKSVLRYEFPAREDMPAVTVYWYDGGHLPPRPVGIPEDLKLGDGNNGSLFIGDNGYIAAKTYGDDPQLLPAARFEGFQRPVPILPRVPGGNSHLNWINAIKNGNPEESVSNFDYASPFTEWVLLGNLALRTNKRIEWDARNMRVTNAPEANQYVKREYRAGWSL
jgi:predicted dehydrogenase